MTGRILIVDNVLANAKLLESRLAAEYYTVLIASDSFDALALCEKGACDVVLLSVSMPEMDGYEICRRIKNAPKTSHLPVIMIVPAETTNERQQGLQAGADDFLTLPIENFALFTRVRSLLKLKQLADELRGRRDDFLERENENLSKLKQLEDYEKKGCVLLVEDRQNAADRVLSSLSQKYMIEQESRAEQVLVELHNGVDVVILSLGLQTADPLRLIANIRADQRMRHLPILVIADKSDDPRIGRSMDLGANDYILRPLDRFELLVRTATQIRRKIYQDQIRSRVKDTIELATVDPLTKLHNRRYLENKLNNLTRDHAHKNSVLALLVLDIDHFKSINDRYGHDGGDEVLREFANRLRCTARNVDILARFGGEEFVLVMPDTEGYAAQKVAERMRNSIESEPFIVTKAKIALRVTVSIGAATMSTKALDTNQLFSQADEALYEAKKAGRNCVKLAA